MVEPDEQIPLEKVTEGWGQTGNSRESFPRSFAGGAAGVHLHSGQHDQRRVIDFYGQEVLPGWPKVISATAA